MFVGRSSLKCFRYSGPMFRVVGSFSRNMKRHLKGQAVMEGANQLSPAFTFTMADISPLTSSSDEPLISPSTLAASGVSTLAIDPTNDVIPPVHTHRTLVLCFDGTGDQFDADVSLPRDTSIASSDDTLFTELERRPVLFHAEEG